MKDYIKTNKIAYENTAEEFQTKKAVRLKGETSIANAFRSNLKEKARVLELGTGSGQLSRLLCDSGLKIDAIEYAPKMAELATLTAPKAHIIVDEFLEHKFEFKEYDGIIGIAFIHLFNAEDAKQVLAKINSLLTSGGILMLSTTVHNRTFDSVVKKTNFITHAYRFRRHYSLKDFKALIESSDFKIKMTTIVEDNEVPGKEWVDIVAVKN